MRDSKTQLETQEEHLDHSFIDGPYIFMNQDSLDCYSIRCKLPSHRYKIEKSTIPIPPDGKLSFNCFIDNSAIVTLPHSFQFEINFPGDHSEEVCEYEEPKKLLAVSDIEGNFYGLKNLLSLNGVIDEEYNWTFKDGHLVITGDLIDRGINVAACLWLIYKLDVQAKTAGGKVHYLLGNHEVMNFSGDFRYVNQKYKSYHHALNWNYYNHFSNASFLARWQKQKNSVEKIGKYLFLHAGFSKEVLQHQFPLMQINNLIRKNLDTPVEEIEADAHRMLLDELGPLWYRGLIERDRKNYAATTEGVIETLDYYEVKKIVVGHTLVPYVQQFHDDKVIAIDTNMPGKRTQSRVQALLIDNGKEFVVDEKGNKWEL